MADFYIGEGDLLPELTATLRDVNGAIDLTAASSVRFHMRVPGSTGAGKVEAAATIVTAASGIVKYTWTGTDTDTAGSYYGEFEVTWSGGRKQTFPNNGKILIEITADVA